MLSSHVHQWDYDTAHDALQAEPTKTQSTRRQYARKLRAVLGELNTVIDKAVGERDIFGLESSRSTQSRHYPRQYVTRDALIEPPNNYEFEKRADKITGFRTWLRNQAEDDILRPYGRGGNRFVEAGYEHGIKSAEGELGKIDSIDVGGKSVDAVIRRPVHKDELEAVFARNYRQLEGMTEAMGSDMSRVLADGLSAGKHPNEMAGDLTDIIGSGGASGASGAHARATMIARTEVLNAHHMAALNRYEEFGIEKGNLILASDACSQCASIKANGPYPIDNLRSMVPAHPNCRCSVSPVT